MSSYRFRENGASSDGCIAPPVTDIPNISIRNDPCRGVANELPEFDFRAVALLKSSREQLAKIYEAVLRGGKAASERSGLRNLLIANSFDPKRGTYIPISPDVFLVGKLPVRSEQVPRLHHTRSPTFPFEAEYFTNALVIPKDYGTAGFDPDKAPKPRTRLTNIGFLVVTMEYDCKALDEFEENLSWTRGDPDKIPFAKVDRELGKLRDYRGYCIVLSGSRSIHFHCLFSTEHLKNAPFDSNASHRLRTFQDESALLENAYQVYWDHTDAVFKHVLKPSLVPDDNLRKATLWRRAPFGIRTLKKDSEILGLRRGTKIPQIVIREKLRGRAADGAKEFLVPPSFSVATRAVIHASRRNETNFDVTDASRLVSLLQDGPNQPNSWRSEPANNFGRSSAFRWLVGI